MVQRVVTNLTILQYGLNLTNMIVRNYGLWNGNECQAKKTMIVEKTLGQQSEGNTKGRRLAKVKVYNYM